jgi:hypothetical protein
MYPLFGPGSATGEFHNLRLQPLKVMEILVFVGIALFFSLLFWSAVKLNKERGL